MNQKLISLYLIFTLSISCIAQNKLSNAEKKSGYVLLFDGKSTQGWRGTYRTEFPKFGWVIKDGELRGEHSAGAESAEAGDIVTIKKYKNFDLIFSWKLGKGGNSGVKYFIEERQPKPQGSQAGYEYQLIDDANYIYNGKNLPQDLKTAAIYDVLAAQKPDVSIDFWHLSKIVVNNNHIEHWLDGVKVLEINRMGSSFIEGVKDSKFKDYPNFSTIKEGHILLQDHGHNVAFKNIKIKEL